MSTKMTVRALGNKRMELCHLDSGAKFVTDAPKDNNGQGSAFSPTDLLAVSLPTCILTVMEIVAERDGIDLSTANSSVEKEMSTDSPRRISKLKVDISLPSSLTEPQRQKLERVAHTCPVHHSIHPDIAVEVRFLYA